MLDQLLSPCNPGLNLVGFELDKIQGWHLPGPRVPSASGISRHRPVPPLQRYPLAFYVLPKRHGTVARAMPLLATAHDGA
jgi:hypothetical protein